MSSSIRERTRAAVRGEGAAGGGSSEDEGASSETGGGAPGGGSGAAPGGCVGLACCRRTKRAGDRGGEGWGSRSGARSRCPRGTSRGGGGPIQMRSGPRHCAVGWAPRAELGDRRARGANVAPLGADCTMSIVRTRAPTGVSRENAGAKGSVATGHVSTRIAHARGRSSERGGPDASKIGTEGSRSGRSSPSGRACLAPAEATLVLREAFLSRRGAYRSDSYGPTAVG